MIEQDYIMRLIKEMIRAILKLLFNIDTENPTAELMDEKEDQDALERLYDLVDSGNINEAENQIYEMTSGGDMRSLEIALLFYSYLNEKDDDFLAEHDFSRDEIQSGIKDLNERYGLSGMVDVFLM